MWVALLIACRPPASEGSETEETATTLPGTVPTGDTAPVVPTDPWPTTEWYTLVASLQSTETVLIDGEGEIARSWTHAWRPGVAAELTPAGELVRTGALPAPPAFEEDRGGLGGIVEILDADGALRWSYSLSTDEQVLHHDFAVLPNGNLLLNSFVPRDEDELVALGRDPELVGPLGAWGEEVIEVCREGASSTCTDGEIVWRWSVWDHVVQDRDPSAANYVPDVAAAPQAVDIDLGAGAAVVDWLHVNSVDYHPATDRVLLSVRELDEVWIIDRATGAISSRFGGEGILFGQHDAHFIPGGLSGAGHVLLFNNGTGRPDGSWSSVEEWCVPPECTEPARVWLYEEGQGGAFYASNLSSAQRLPDGATAICEGPAGELREVEADGTVRWQAAIPLEGLARSVFRAPRYPPP